MLAKEENNNWYGGVLTPSALLSECEANEHLVLREDDAGEDGDSQDDTNSKYGCSISLLQRRLRAGSYLAHHAREILRTRLGYTCSGGIAKGPTLAKMVGRLRKPDDQTTLLPGAHVALLNGLPLKKVPGCGRSAYRHLEQVPFWKFENWAGCGTGGRLRTG